MVIEAGKMIREYFLQQSAFSAVDASCSLEKAYWMIRGIRAFYEEATAALERGKPIDEILNLPQNEQIARFKEIPNDQFRAHAERFLASLPEAFGAVPAGGGAAASPSPSAPVQRGGEQGGV